ncbi:hypothetical protein BaRGS_00007028 [Batillaria attramentaria]|uniref:Cyclin N-terminal domain-containing protein n=1 Tax=Batillaria attramentaria TaxID=370345 RepID=A0ABD0LRF5_9CAEN
MASFPGEDFEESSSETSAERPIEAVAYAPVSASDSPLRVVEDEPGQPCKRRRIASSEDDESPSCEASGPHTPEGTPPSSGSEEGRGPRTPAGSPPTSDSDDSEGVNDDTASSPGPQRNVALVVLLKGLGGFEDYVEETHSANLQRERAERDQMGQRQMDQMMEAQRKSTICSLFVAVNTLDLQQQTLFTTVRLLDTATLQYGVRPSQSLAVVCLRLATKMEEARQSVPSVNSLLQLLDVPRPEDPQEQEQLHQTVALQERSVYQLVDWRLGTTSSLAFAAHYATSTALRTASVTSNEDYLSFLG